MGTSRGGKDNSTQDQFKDQSTQAIQNASTVNPLQQQEQDRLLKFNNQMDNGTDVSQMDYLKPYYNLYNNAANSDTEGNVGQGLLGNNQLSGANGQMAGVIGQQLADRRKQNASGQLYNAAMQARQDATGEGNVIAGADTAQRMGVAGLYTDRFNQFVRRPKSQPFWQQLLLQGMKTGGDLGSAALSGGGGGE